MNLNHPRERSQFLQSAFSQIAGQYEWMNQIMTFGQVNAWRRTLIRMAHPAEEMRILDLGAGGGEMTSLIRQVVPRAAITAADFNQSMIRNGSSLANVHWNAADARCLPYPSATFNLVTSAFLLRNIVDYPTVLGEIWRVLKPGGRYLALDTTPPRSVILKPFVRFHMRVLIPFIGGIVTGSPSAYRYMIRSTEDFTPAEALEQEFQAAGFTETRFITLMFGTAAIHSGQKPE